MGPIGYNNRMQNHTETLEICQPALFRERTERMTKMPTFERVAYRMKGRRDIFDQDWSCFLELMESVGLILTILAPI